MILQKITSRALSITIAGFLIAPSAGWASENGADRPFTASLSFTEQIVSRQAVPNAPCPVFTGSISGTGSASHLGNAAVTSVDCFTPVSATLYTFVSNQVTITSANGDQLFATYAGTFMPATGTISGTYMIYGGTGRFANAGGTGSISGTEDITKNPAIGQIQLTGSIAY